MSEILTHLGAWTAVPNQVLFDCQLSKSTTIVYVALLSHARPEKGEMVVWPGIKRIMEMTGFGKTAVGEAIAELTRGVEGHRGPLIERKQRLGQSSVTRLLNISEAYYQPPEEPPERLPSGRGAVTKEPPERLVEGDVIERDVVTACVSSPRTTVVETNSDYLTKKELARRERDEVLGKHRPPEERKAPARAKIGKELADFWDTEVVPRCDILQVASRSATCLSAAGRAFESLRDTKWCEHPTGDVMLKVIDEIKACDPAVRKTVTFEMLFVSKAENLPKLLNGNWRAAKGVASETAGWGKDIL